MQEYVDYVDAEENISTVQLKDENRTYYIESDQYDDFIRDEIEDSADELINGCVYSNKDDYLDASRSSKRIFEYDEIDVGWH